MRGKKQLICVLTALSTTERNSDDVSKEGIYQLCPSGDETKRGQVHSGGLALDQSVASSPLVPRRMAECGGAVGGTHGNPLMMAAVFLVRYEMWSSAKSENRQEVFPFGQKSWENSCGKM